MELLPLHIEYLLTRHDCVIVPGFGAFIATETEAYFDSEKGIINPRKREISFNSSVVTDDGLLSHSIARRERLSYEEAHRLMSALICKMNSDLRNEGEVSLGMVGRLVLDAEGFINFVPRRSYVNSEILFDIELPKQEEEEIEVRNTEEFVERSSSVADIEDDGMRTIRVAPDRYVFTISKRAVHVAAMLIALFTIGLSLLIPINHDNEQKASVISIEELFHHSQSKEKAVNMTDSVDSQSASILKTAK